MLMLLHMHLASLVNMRSMVERKAKRGGAAAPKAPPIVPTTKPALRPNRPMKAESGVAVSIEPITMAEIGSVAQQAFGAKDCPASPPMVKIIGICAPKMA